MKASCLTILLEVMERDEHLQEVILCTKVIMSTASLPAITSLPMAVEESGRLAGQVVFQSTTARSEVDRKQRLWELLHWFTHY